MQNWKEFDPKRVDLANLADTLEGISSSTAIDPAYQPDSDPPGPRVRQVKPVTPIIETPNK